MTPPETRDLVVDADVAQSAGNSDSQMSIDARKVLEKLRESGHRIVWSTEIEEEWNRHFTEFSLDWYTTMTISDKVLDLKNVNVRDESLREDICNFAPDIHIYRILQEDVHLLEAALFTDKSIVSKDKRARRHFGNISLQIKKIRDVVWVNPDVADDQCTEWLKLGAPVETARQLGYQHRSH